VPYLCENIEMWECESRVWDVIENKTLCDGVCPFSDADCAWKKPHAKSLWLLHTGNQFVHVHCVEIAAPQRNEDARHCRLGRAK